MENEYQINGLTYCAICNKPKQMRTKRGIRNVLCECERIERDNRERSDRIAKNVRNCWSDYNDRQRMHYGRRLDDLEQSNHVRAAKLYVAHFAENREEGRGLLITGDVGTGKSTLAAAIVNDLLRTGITARFTNFSHIADNMKAKTIAEQEGYRKLLTRVGLLVIDDYGIERSSGDMYKLMYDIINARYEAMNPIIITTNIPIQEITKATSISDKRLNERLYHRNKQIKMDGVSIRRMDVRKEFQSQKKVEDITRGLEQDRDSLKTASVGF